MPREPAMRGANLDWNRELCKQGCREWIPWYRGKKGETVYGCRLGVIPEKRNEQWCCREHKRRKGGDDASI